MKPSAFIDKWGLLDKLAAPDGGDSCQREGMFWALIGMMTKPLKYKWLAAINRDSVEWFIVMKKLHPHNGVLLRHSNPRYDASDWDRMSRDQLQPVVIACGYHPCHLGKLTLGHLKRGFLFTNNVRQNGATKRNHGSDSYSYAWKFPDLTGPEIWANFIRSWNAWYLYPLLIIFDLELLVGAIKWRFFPRHNIAMNQALSQMQALDRMPTLFSWIASKVMPMDKYITLIASHFTDFGVGKDMQFFSEMFQDALESINGN